jgi:poly(3-hydroxybutyrate) depolymerase
MNLNLRLNLNLNRHSIPTLIPTRTPPLTPPWNPIPTPSCRRHRHCSRDTRRPALVGRSKGLRRRARSTRVHNGAIVERSWGLQGLAQQRSYRESDVRGDCASRAACRKRETIGREKETGHGHRASYGDGPRERGSLFRPRGDAGVKTLTSTAGRKFVPSCFVTRRLAWLEEWDRGWGDE